MLAITKHSGNLCCLEIMLRSGLLNCIIISIYFLLYSSRSKHLKKGGWHTCLTFKDVVIPAKYCISYFLKHMAKKSWFLFSSVLEPAGSSVPKFPTMEKSQGFRARVNHYCTLLWPVQGFPVPTFRWDSIAFWWLNFHFIEPVGSSIPKFPTMDNVRGFQVMRDQTFTLLCPAQGFPLPTYR
jgi:hypothetical protein